MKNDHMSMSFAQQLDLDSNQRRHPNPGFLPFIPPLILRNRHVQTLSGAYLFGRSAKRFTDPSITTQRGEVPLGDGDRLVYHDDCPATWQLGDRVVVLLHGLSGSHASPYMVRTGGQLNRMNVRTFRLDWRGSGAGISLARYPYHSGRSEDLRATLTAIQKQCPGSDMSLIGYSMGGNVALKFLGERANANFPGIRKAVAICPPIDLSKTIRFIQTGTARLYNNYFAKACVRDVRHRKRLFPEAIVPEGWFTRLPREMREFDETFTAPVCGFASAEDYYRKSSANQFLPYISVPTLLIAAQDDPLIPFCQFSDATLSDSVLLCAPKYGGHVGFVTTQGPDWLDSQVIRWIMNDD